MCMSSSLAIILNVVSGIIFDYCQVSITSKTATQLEFIFLKTGFAPLVTILRQVGFHLPYQLINCGLVTRNIIEKQQNYISSLIPFTYNLSPVSVSLHTFISVPSTIALLCSGGTELSVAVQRNNTSLPYHLLLPTGAVTLPF